MKGRNVEHALYYDDELLEKLQLRWGDGLLSPGGAEELARMLRGVPVQGCTGLDVGCGLGGYDELLVSEHEVARMVGVDINAAAIAQARERAARSGLGRRLEFQVIEPGGLPFGDRVFDFVFSKDTIADVPLAGKSDLFAHMYRVLKPGGWMIVSDWFRSEAPYTEEMRAWATEGDETYDMDTLAAAAAYARQAGFVQIEQDDRNAWFREYARDEYERLQGPLFATCVERFGESAARASVENARIRALLAEQGQLRPGHIRAKRPD